MLIDIHRIAISIKTMRKIFLLSLYISLLASCMQLSSSKKNELSLEIIETFLKGEYSVGEIEGLLGKPDEVEKYEGEDKQIYSYNNKKNNLREWRLGANKNNKITWIIYIPWENPLLDRMEVLPNTLASYNCKKKTKPDKRVPHVIHNYTFFECANGKLRAFYNMHGEIRNIAIHK